MDDRFECPDCLRTHDEPAEAALGLRARCFDCFFEREEAETAMALELDAAA